MKVPPYSARSYAIGATANAPATHVESAECSMPTCETFYRAGALAAIDL